MTQTRQGYLRYMLKTLSLSFMWLMQSAMAVKASCYIQSAGIWSSFQFLLDIRELWIAFDTSFIPAHKISLAIGPRKSMALPLLHAYTGYLPIGDRRLPGMYGEDMKH